VLQPAHHVPLSHPHWTDGRAVSALRWLPDLPQVLVSAHIPSGRAADSYVASNGVVAIWDVEHASLTRALIDAAPVTSLAVHPLSPSLVIGGTAYGRILTWDTRSRTPTPCSSGSSGSVSVIRSLESTHGSSSLVLSASENGTVCVWALASLEKPVESMVARERGVRDLHISAMRIPSSAVFARSREASSLGKRAVFCLASEDGGVYRVDNANDRWVVRHGTARHDCPITSMACHPGHPRYHHLADILITTSLDWSVGLWAFGRRGPGLRLARFGTDTMNTTCDAAWSPSHPGVFAVGDDGGGVSIFDISRPDSGKLVGRRDAQVFESGHKKQQTAPFKAGVNRLQWNPSGSLLAAGDKNGSIFLWTISEALANPDDLAWESTSSQIKHWRTQAAAAVPNVQEIANPRSYVFKGIPPLFNPLYSE
jgi:dynein intermediate chain, cytosolic